MLRRFISLIIIFLIVSGCTSIAPIGKQTLVRKSLTVVVYEVNPKIRNWSDKEVQILNKKVKNVPVLNIPYLLTIISEVSFQNHKDAYGEEFDEISEVKKLILNEGR